MPQYLLSELSNPGTPAYNAYDSLLTYEINDVLNTLPPPGPIYNFSRALQAPVLDMMLRGIHVNKAKITMRKEKLKSNLTIVEEILKTIMAAIWDKPWETNHKGLATLPNSTKQLIDLFYGTMGLPTITKKIKGQIKVPMDRAILERLQMTYIQVQPLISLIIAHRDITGELEVLETGIDDDERIRCSFNIAAATTGRFSTSESTTGSGRNLQNITEDLRYLLTCDINYKLCALDKSQAESREFGFFCGAVLGDWSYLDMIEAGDPHTYTARLVWPNLPWTGDIHKDREIAEQPFYRHLSYRDMSKRCGHGTNYLGQPYTISQEIKAPQALVKSFQEKYFNAFPVVSDLHKWVAAQLQTKGYLVNVFGRRRDFLDRKNSPETLKQAVAFLFQSATADDLNLGLWRIWKHMSGRAQLLLQLHDAVYFQFHRDHDEKAIIQEAQSLLNVDLYAPNTNRAFVVPTEALVGYNFGHKYKRDENGKKKLVNPQGLDTPEWL